MNGRSGGGRDPLVSVLIPTYNRVGMLAQSLRSAMSQTYRSLEIIVADNCSSDDTPALVAEMAAGDSRIRSIRHAENLGYLGNIGALLTEARGEFVKFLMDDDLLAPDCVESLVRPCILDDSIGFATSKRTCVDQHMKPLPDVAATQSLRDTDGVFDGIQLGDLVLRANLNVLGEGTTVLFRRSLLPAGPEMLTFGDHDFEAILDVSLWLKILSQANAFYCATPKSFYRMHGGQGGSDYIAPFLGTIEWGLIIGAAKQFGFLASVDAELEAVGTFVRSASQIRPRITDAHHRMMLDEALASAGDRLAALATGRFGPEQRSADGRASRALREVSRAEALRGALPGPRPEAAASATVTVIVDDDVEPQPGWRATLEGVLDACPGVDAVTGLRVHPDGRASAAVGAVAVRAQFANVVSGAGGATEAIVALHGAGVAVSLCPSSVVREVLPPSDSYKYDVSIVISMRDPGDALLRCLGSVEDHTAGCSYEVVLVDHGSTDGTAMLLDCLEGDVQIFKHGRDEGTVESDGVTRAVWAAQGRDLVFLPATAEVAPGWLTTEVKLLAADERAGAVEAGDAVVVRRSAYVDAGGLDRLEELGASGSAVERLLGRMRRRGWTVTSS